MKLTREDFRNYIKDYNDDEIFYRDLYFQEKNHPETFHNYCLNLDRQFISNHRLFVPELQKEAWYPYMQEKDLFGDLTGNIMFVIAKKHCPEHDQHGIQEGVAVFFMPEIFDIKIFQHITDADIIKSMENQIIPLSFTIKYMCKKMGKCAVSSQ